MAEIVERQVIKPDTLTMGGDTHRGITQVNVELNTKNLYPVFHEGDLSPRAYEPIRNTSAAVSLRVTSMSRDALTSLLNQPAGDVTYRTKEPGTSNFTISTVTSVDWTSGSVTASQERSGEFQISGQGVAYSEAAA